MDVLKKYQEYCSKNGIPFGYYSSIKTYDPTTLFCSAGMQQYKQDFSDLSIAGKTIANSQACLRTNDLDLVGDGIHSAYFNMLGLFSFRDWTVDDAISFWLGFIEELGLKLSYATVHSDRRDWTDYYPRELSVKMDDECKWSDGAIGGYCTEFYIDGVEIGNIVNPLGTCIDAGFGLERLQQLVDKSMSMPRYIELVQAAEVIHKAGYEPSNKEQGYILRKLLRMIWKEGLAKGISTPWLLLQQEIKRQEKLEAKYLKLKDKFPNKDAAWWFDTHGIEI